MEKAIGGYFELELRSGDHYHQDALRLNSGRNCFEYILRANRYKRVYVPYYTCEVMLPPLKDNHIEYMYYHIGENLEPVEKIKLQAGEAFLYTNYFGLKQHCVERLAGIYGERLIVDDSQAFFAPRLSGVDTFYSARKFFGVPDGAYLYSNKILDVNLQRAVSCTRIMSLVKRIDISAEAGYGDFQTASEELCERPVELMSVLTEKLLCSVDYAAAADKRRENFRYLHERLANGNRLKIDDDPGAVPMVYPLWQNDSNLKKKLISNRIFVATYWPNIFDWCAETSVEYNLAKNTVSLPVDQRYGLSEMERICMILQS